jgi:hypothetical protein
MSLFSLRILNSKLLLKRIAVPLAFDVNETIKTVVGTASYLFVGHYNMFISVGTV